MIRFGTSGFSYDDWIGPVYPTDLPKRQWLEFYSEEFDTVELNVTYYRVPPVSTVEGWAKRTPDGFLFSVKANKSLTHERAGPDFEAFAAGIDPLIQSGKLACVLAQFPYSFHSTQENIEYLGELRRGLQGIPTVVEFRDHGWVTEETFALLESLDFGYCAVDEPRLRGLMPPVARSSGPVSYVRFHGRNAEKWWKHEHAWERYDYTYSEEELKEWIPKILELDTEDAFVLIYANNHYRGQSIDTIRKLRQMLGEAH
ncbi:MAG: DUF72 domain-containing protein [Anaerolineales bacterium]